MLRVQAIDHIVLNIADIEKSVAFYHDVLGLEIERMEQWRAGKVRFPSVRLSDATIIDLFAIPAPPSERGARIENLNHFCVVVEDDALEPFIDELATHGVGVDRGPARRWGARGDGVSVYLYDPDGNEIEVRTYSPVAMERAAARSEVAAG